MNLFQGLLFQLPAAPSGSAEDFGPRYGNRRAAERRFSEPFARPWFSGGARLESEQLEASPVLQGCCAG